jgi:hypothetical protein
VDAIETRYIGAGGTRPSRIKATSLGNYARSIYWAYDHSLNVTENHWAAARALIVKLGWLDVTFYNGSTKTGYVWVADTGRDLQAMRVGEWEVAS